MKSGNKMKSGKFFGRELVALAICFALGGLLTRGTTMTVSGNNPPPANSAGDESFVIPGLGRDVDDLERFSKDMLAYVGIYNELQSKAKVSRMEADSLMKLEPEAKRMASMYKGALSSAMSKIQTAGKWNSALDVHVMKLIEGSSVDAGKKQNVLSAMRGVGGYRALMAKTRDLMDQVPGMFTDAMDDVKKKIAAGASLDSGLVHAAYVPAGNQALIAEVVFVKKEILSLCAVCIANLTNCLLTCGSQQCFSKCDNRFKGCPADCRNGLSDLGQ